MKKKILSILTTCCFFATVEMIKAQENLDAISLLRTIHQLNVPALQELLPRIADAFGTTATELDALGNTWHDEDMARKILTFRNTPPAAKKIISDWIRENHDPTDAEFQEMLKLFAPLIARVFGVNVATITDFYQKQKTAAYQQLFDESTLSRDTKEELVKVLFTLNGFLRTQINSKKAEIERLRSETITAQQAINRAQKESNQQQELIKQAAINALPVDSKERYKYLQYLVNGGAAELLNALIQENGDLAYRRWILDPNVAASESNKSRQNGDIERARFIEWFSPMGVAGLDKDAQTILQGEKRDLYNYYRFVMNGGASPEIETLKNTSLNQRPHDNLDTYGRKIQDSQTKFDNSTILPNMIIRYNNTQIQTLEREIGETQPNLITLK